MKIPLIQDDREKVRTWDSDYLGPDFTIERRRLLTGDYTLAGMEDVVCIEKKSGWEEICGNIASKKKRNLILNELDRMQQYPIRILAVHGDMSSIPSTQQYGYPLSWDKISQFIMDVSLEYGVFVLPLGHYRTSAPYVRQMLKTLWEYDKNGRLYTIRGFLESFKRGSN